MKLAGRDVTPKVLNVKEVREVMEHLRERSGLVATLLDLHPVDLLFDDEIPAIAVAKSTGFTLDELEGPVDVDELAAVIKEVRVKNPFLVGMMERLVTVGKGGSPRTDREPSSMQ